MKNNDPGVKDEETTVIPERRRVSRLQEDNDVTITVISEAIHLPKGRIFYNLGKDISTSGIRIQGNIFLPVNSHLEIEVSLNDPPRRISTFAKIKWIRTLPSSESYESGLEFVNTSGDMIRQLDDYIQSRL